MRELNVDLLETFKVEGLPISRTLRKSTVVGSARCGCFSPRMDQQPLVERVSLTALYDRRTYSAKRLRKS
jgi:hypothetical protein